MNDSHITTIAQIKEFGKVARGVKLRGKDKQETYQWIGETLGKFRYFSCPKKDKSIVKGYIMAMTGLSDAQATRLIGRKRKTGRVEPRGKGRHRFPKRYGPQDIALLGKTDNAHQRLSGPATKEILRREHEVFGKKEYETISGVSSSHIYNLRETRQYQSHALCVKHTNPTKVPIGERVKPETQGQPGFLRIDTVHQGDLDKEKGVYHINCVDEITQWEVVGCVEKISEQYLVPLLEDLLQQYPFVILGFHSDNGSEYINKVVAQLLNKMLIRQTKSRARHCNDNSLVEGKNGSVVRKHMGRMHIPQKHASAINQFYKDHMNVYLNYHRPCGFATVIVDRKGKEKKAYKTWRMPYEAFCQLPNAESYLKEGVTFEGLHAIAYAQSDNECAQAMQQAKDELFKTFKQKLQFPTTFTTFVSGSSLD